LFRICAFNLEKLHKCGNEGYSCRAIPAGKNTMNEKETMSFVGLLLCVFGTVALIQLNIEGAVFLLGVGLAFVAVARGFVKELFDVFIDIFKSIFKL
jgi:hypothetical protein